jgi:hypothetical protein
MREYANYDLSLWIEDFSLLCGSLLLFTRSVRIDYHGLLVLIRPFTNNTPIVAKSLFDSHTFPRHFPVKASPLASLSGPASDIVAYVIT